MNSSQRDKHSDGDRSNDVVRNGHARSELIPPKRLEFYFDIIQRAVRSACLLDCMQCLIRKLKPGQAIELLLPDDLSVLDAYCKALLRGSKNISSLEPLLQPRLKIVSKNENKRRNRGYVENSTCVIYSIRSANMTGWTHMFALPQESIPADDDFFVLTKVLDDFKFEQLPIGTQGKWNDIFEKCFPVFKEASTPQQRLAAARSGCASCGLQGTKKTKKCEACLTSRYCSIACQRKDRSHHKQYCDQIQTFGAVIVHQVSADVLDAEAMGARQDISQLAQSLREAMLLSGDVEKN